MFKRIDKGFRVLVASVLLASAVGCSVMTPTLEVESANHDKVEMVVSATEVAGDTTDFEASDVEATTEGEDVAVADEPEPEPTKTLRRIKSSELNQALVEKAREIIHEHHDKPFGTEIPFEIDGREYVGKIEQHYHPEGGELRPWGCHPGCSLFAVEAG